jgi:hypothetical protein
VPWQQLTLAQELRKRKHLKVLYSQAAEIFNKNPKEGIEFLKGPYFCENCFDYFKRQKKKKKL